MKIAITQRVIDFRNGPYDSIDHGFYDMFRGHTLYPIPNDIDHFDNDLIINCDLVVFSGGNSMMEDSWQYNEKRLLIEQRTLVLAQEHNKPMLGISKGCQFLTTSLGGSIKPASTHHKDHSVCYNNTIVSVHSRHEEVLSRIPNGAICLATDTEGNCESWHMDNIVVVLWHPERMNNHWLPKEAYEITGL